MKKIVFLLLALIPLLTYGQKGKMEFEKTSHNFGTINENDGKVSHVFTFKNTGTGPIILTQVRAGCGCTTPEWNRQPVAPGETGNIKVSFDPRHRPGVFTKGITVNSNAENSVLTLTIRGNVSRKKGPYDEYKFPVGALRLTNSSVNFGIIKNTEQREKQIGIINTSSAPLNVSLISNSPAITATVVPATLNKNQKGTITIAYDAAAKGDWDFVTDKIQLKVNDKEMTIIGVSAHINEDFSSNKDQADKAPIASFSEKEIVLSGLTKDNSQTHEFTIQNTGKTDLIIRKIITSDENISVNVAKNTIRPGKKAKATVTLKTTNAPKILKIVKFILNDPKNPVVTYKISGDVH